MSRMLPISVAKLTRVLSRWDLLAVLLVIGILVFFAEASRNLLQPLSELQQAPLSLEPTHLPEYAARTTLRMLVALGLSLIFTFHLRDAGRQEQACRAPAGSAPGYSSVGADPRLHFGNGRFFMAMAPGRVAGRRTR